MGKAVHGAAVHVALSSQSESCSVSRFYFGEKVCIMIWQGEFGLEPIIGKMNPPWESCWMFFFPRRVPRVTTAYRKWIVIHPDSSQKSDGSVSQVDSIIVNSMNPPGVFWCDWIQHCLARSPLAETGLQMAFDDFVIERNLVSCLRTNEVDRESSGREEYSGLQIGGGERVREREWAAVTLTYLVITAIIIPSRCWTAALDFFVLWKLRMSGEKTKRTDGGDARLFLQLFHFFLEVKLAVKQEKGEGNQQGQEGWGQDVLCCVASGELMKPVKERKISPQGET